MLFSLLLFSKLQDQSSNDETEPQLGARRSLLAILPRIVASVSLLWKALCTGKQRYTYHV